MLNAIRKDVPNVPEMSQKVDEKLKKIMKEIELLKGENKNRISENKEINKNLNTSTEHHNELSEFAEEISNKLNEVSSGLVMNNKALHSELNIQRDTQNEFMLKVLKTLEPNNQKLIEMNSTLEYKQIYDHKKQQSTNAPNNKTEGANC